MLNRWRTVEYTDDGCSVYACLSCHAQWEARTSPEHAHWRFCPVCGTHWRGALPLNRERANFGWSRKVGGVSDRQRELAQLCQPMWQVFYKNSFTEGWETDGEPFRGSAKLAVSFVNNHKRHGQPKQDRYATQYRIELVKAERCFPLPP